MRNPFAPPQNPITDAELAQAAHAAETLMSLELAKRWGLVDDKGRTNVRRCEQIVGRALQKGIPLVGKLKRNDITT